MSAQVDDRLFARVRPMLPQPVVRATGYDDLYLDERIHKAGRRSVRASSELSPRDQASSCSQTMTRTLTSGTIVVIYCTMLETGEFQHESPARLPPLVFSPRSRSLWFGRSRQLTLNIAGLTLNFKKNLSFTL
jgi:hypothetical protein